MSLNMIRYGADEGPGSTAAILRLWEPRPVKSGKVGIRQKKVGLHVCVSVSNGTEWAGARGGRWECTGNVRKPKKGKE